MWRLGGTDLFATVTFEGQSRSIVDTFASVDHPFHATRAATLLDALRDGHWLRWLGDHQGGYPAEFYPLGIAWLDVVLWAAFFGSLPIVAIHTLTILLIFVLPAAGFWILARGDGANPWVPVLATALHVSIPGLWTHGGSEELLHWGLVTNVAGATFALIASAALVRAVIEGAARWAAVAIVLTAYAAYTNPRSILALAIAALALVASAALFPHGAPPLRVALGRIVAVGGAAALLAAPLLVPLIRYRDLYFFVHYERYDSVGTYWSNTQTAVSPPVLGVAVVGVGLALFSVRFPVARVFAVTLIGYAVLTLVLSWSPDLIEQLEPPRLMPFQRLLVIYFAAFGIAGIVQRLVTFFRVGRPAGATGAVLAVVALIVPILMWGSFWTPPEAYRTSEPDTTADGSFVPAPRARPESEFVAFQEAVGLAGAARPQGTAILVIGDRGTWWWHEQLWAPSVVEAPFFYDDWLWYWHTDHEGPYEYLRGHFYPDPARTFDAAYLQAHGIGAVVVTSMPVPARATDPKVAAARDSDLNRAGSAGAWDVYTVSEPVAIVTNGEVDGTDVTVEDHHLTARFASASGEIEIRRNWFPRWRAEADGQPVEIQRTANGYMRVTVPPGTTHVELSYATTLADWLARAAALAGVALTVLVVRGWDRTVRLTGLSRRKQSDQASLVAE